MRKIMMAAMALLLLGADEPKTDPLAPFEFFVGRWKGTGIAPEGESTVEREYRRAMEGRYIEVRSGSRYATKDGKEYLHEEQGMFSFDAIRKQRMLRLFYSEGYVGRFVLDSMSADGKRLAFTSESIENGEDGWRAREAYTILGPDEFVETFELAEPGKDFQVYSTNRLRRVR